MHLHLVRKYLDLHQVYFLSLSVSTEEMIFMEGNAKEQKLETRRDIWGGRKEKKEEEEGIFC